MKKTKYFFLLFTLVFVKMGISQDTMKYRKFQVDFNMHDTFENQVLYWSNLSVEMPIFLGSKRALEINNLMPERLVDESIYKNYYSEHDTLKTIDSALCKIMSDSLTLLAIQSASEAYQSNDFEELYGITPISISHSARVIFNKNNHLCIELFSEFLLGSIPYFFTNYYTFKTNTSYEYSNWREVIKTEDTGKFILLVEKLLKKEMNIPQEKDWSETEYSGSISGGFFVPDEFGICDEGLLIVYGMNMISGIEERVLLPWNEVNPMLMNSLN